MHQFLVFKMDIKSHDQLSKHSSRPLLVSLAVSALDWPLRSATRESTEDCYGYIGVRLPCLVQAGA